MFNLTQEQISFRKNVRAFVEDEIFPIASNLDTFAKFPYQIIKRCGDLGFLNILFSHSAPSGSLKATEGVIFLEEISRGLGSLGLIFCPQFQGTSLLLSSTSDYLKSEVLIPALKGEKILSYAIGEETGGTNALDISTTAVRDGDSWIINGKKSWITNAGISDGYLITARTGSVSKRRSISFFYISSKDKGVIAHERAKMIGLRNSVMGNVEFINCRIPADRLIGFENEGYELMKSSLNQGRLQIGAIATGISQRAMELAIDYSSNRESCMRKLTSYQGISFPIADMFTHIIALRNMVYHTAALCESGVPYSIEGASLKVFASETCRNVCMQAQDIHGAYGLSQDSEIERCLRDAHMLTAAEGTVSACKISISTALLNGSNPFM